MYTENYTKEMQPLRRLAGTSKFYLNPRVAVNIPALSSFATRSIPTFLHCTLNQRRSNSTAAMASTDAALRVFFQAPKFAVVGASTNTEKYGYKGQY
jgi:hypothetical protein